jgi:hypothetical protein
VSSSPELQPDASSQSLAFDARPRPAQPSSHPKDLLTFFRARGPDFEIRGHQRHAPPPTMADDAFAPSWEKDDKTTSLLGDSIQTNDETEEIGNLTLGQLRRQREQLEQSADLAGDTRRVTRDARRTLKAIAWKVFREKLTLIGTIACLLAIDFALAYRLVSNHGRL